MLVIRPVPGRSCGMDLGSPITSIVASLDGEILSVLAGTTRPLTGRDVQRLVRRGSQSGVSSALARLEQHGILDVVAAGSSNLYTLNRDHVAASAVTNWPPCDLGSSTASGTPLPPGRNCRSWPSSSAQRFEEMAPSTPTSTSSSSAPRASARALRPGPTMWPGWRPRGGDGLAMRSA